MITLLKKMLVDKDTTKPEEEEIKDAHIALCVLLLEAAHVDGECSIDEMNHVVATLTERCGADQAEIDQLIDRAYQKRKDAIDLFSFTRYLNNNCTKDEKLGVMESVWRVIHVDGRLESHEDHFAHKLGNLLRLSHKELIEAKIKAREPLSE